MTPQDSSTNQAIGHFTISHIINLLWGKRSYNGQSSSGDNPAFRETISEITTVVYRNKDFFEIVFTDHGLNESRSIHSWKLNMSDAHARRQALDGVFHVIRYLLRQKAFPLDTWVYSIKEPNLKQIILGYPDGLGKKFPSERK